MKNSKTTIQKLSKSQETALAETYNEWLATGRSCAPLDRDAAAKVIGDMYEKIGEERPFVMFFSSPVMCILAYNALRVIAKERSQLGSQLESQLRSQLESQLGSQLWSQLWSQLGSQLRSQLESQLESQLRSQLGSQLWSQLWSQLRSQLESQLGSQLWSQLWSQLGSQLRSQLESQLESQLRSQLGSQLRSQLWSQLGSQLRSQLWSQLGSQLRSQLGSQLRSQLESQLESQLRSQLWSQLWSQLGSQLSYYFGGSQWCAWEVFYDFCRRIGVNYTQDQNATLDLWLTQSKTCHWWWPYKGLVLASERHTKLSVNSEGQLHCEDGPAVEYSDGWAVWALNGIRVPQELVLTKNIELTEQASRWIAEPNVEVRREYLRKVGIENALTALNPRVLDSSVWGPNPDTEYELLVIDLGSDVGERRVLKMRNPSIGCWHVEGVEDDIETVEQAHNWRASGNKHEPWNPALLT